MPNHAFPVTAPLAEYASSAYPVPAHDVLAIEIRLFTPAWPRSYPMLTVSSKRCEHSLSAATRLSRRGR